MVGESGKNYERSKSRFFKNCMTSAIKLCIYILMIENKWKCNFSGDSWIKMKYKKHLLKVYTKRRGSKMRIPRFSKET